MTRAASQPTKLAVVKVACGGVSDSGFIRAIKVAQEYSQPINPDLRSPLASSGFPRYALDPAFRVRPDFGIFDVLAMRGQSKIVAPVVQPIAVAVINLNFDFRLHDGPMHSETRLPATRSANIANRINLAPSNACGPIKPLHQRNVRRVNDRLIPFREGYVGDVAFDPDRAYLFRHVATSIAAWAGRGRDTSRPVYLGRNHAKAQGVLN